MTEKKKYKTREEDPQTRIILIKEVPELKLSDPISSGIRWLDEKFLGGFRQGELVILGGRSGGGKSLLTLQLIKNYSKIGEKVLLFSFEEPTSRIKWRLGNMGADVENLLCYVPKELKSSSITWLQTKILDGIVNKGIRIIAIDNLDFLTVEKGLRNDNKRAVQGKIIGMLKRMAIVHNVLIILNVHIRKNDGSTPRMEDVHGASEIYKLADTLVFIHRLREKNAITNKVESDSPLTNESLVSIEKNRLLGICGSFRMIYIDGELICLGDSTQNATMKNEKGEEIDLDEVANLF